MKQSIICRLILLATTIGSNSYASHTIPQDSTGLAALKKYHTKAWEKSEGTATAGAKQGVGLAASLYAALAGLVYRSGGSIDTSKHTFTGLTAYFGTFAAGGAIIALLKDGLRNTSKAWLEQLDKLYQYRNNIFKDVLYPGVPSNKRDGFFEKKQGKLYLLSNDFHETKNAFDGKHYELYLMPKDEYLITVFKAIDNICKNDPSLKENVTFIGVRPTPGVTNTKSFWYYKKLPRIIVGFKENIESSEFDTLIKKITPQISQELHPIERYGLNIQPRYSKKINNLMYVAHGSSDYKDTDAGRNKYSPKKTGWYFKLFGPTDEQMAGTELKETHTE